LRFTFGHDHIREHDETVSPTNSFKNLKEQVASRRHAEKWPALVAAEGDEMEIPPTVEAPRMASHV
jgi:hypothetical protein